MNLNREQIVLYANMTAQRIGGGLIEISAVATIVGAPIAESLMHGLKAACGLTWGPTSTFGGIHVMKACLAASVPDWLREALGLRNAFVDNALGVMLDIDQFKQSRHRVDLGDACAIQVSTRSKNLTSSIRVAKAHRWPGLKSNESADPYNVEKGRRATMHIEMTQDQRQSRGQCVYTLDKSSQLVLGSISATQRGEAVKVHRFTPDFEGIVPAWKDWFVILISAVKILESIVLWRLGSHRLWMTTLFGWAHAFVSACLLQICGLGRDSPINCNRDIAAGILPSSFSVGEFGKIVLNTPENVRRHKLWRSLLAIGMFFNAAMLFTTFVFMGDERSVIIYVWVGFQVLWLGSRSVVYYFVEGGGSARQGLILSKTWAETPKEDRPRVYALLDELSKHQVSSHPRSAQAYADDCLSFSYLALLLEESEWKLYTHISTKVPTGGIDVRAATGDCLIRTSAWFTGLQVDSNEIYDACIAFITGEHETTAVSCVRVYTCLCSSSYGRDRGNTNHTCGKLEWAYFIATGDDPDCSWVFAHGRCAVGMLRTEVLTSDELEGRFSVGYWKISIKSLQELRLALRVSQMAGRNLLQMVTAGTNYSTRAGKSKVDGDNSEGVTEEVRELM